MATQEDSPSARSIPTTKTNKAMSNAKQRLKSILPLISARYFLEKKL